MFDYIIYCSTTKIDMLYNQLTDEVSEKLQGKFGVNLGVISGEISTSEQIDDNYMRKLAIVLDYLQQENLVGEIRDYKDYIQGPLLMGWETFDITHWGTKIAFNRDNHLYIVTLFGSKENVIGTPYKGEFDSHSIYPCYVQFAKEHFNDDEITEANVWQLMEGINRQYTGQILSYEFVAKVLYRETLSLDYRAENNHLVSTIDPFEKTTYILATPLYVSLPHKVSEKVRRIDGRNYVAIENFTKRLSRSFRKTEEYLTIILKNAALVEEADNFQMEIKNMGDSITESDFLEIANKYFIIEE